MAMAELLLFALHVLVSYIGSGAVAAALLLKWNDRLELPRGPLLVLGLGMGPFMATLALYYLFLFWPGVPAGVAVAWVLVLALMGGWAAGVGRRRLLQLVGEAWSAVKRPPELFILLGILVLMSAGAVVLAHKPLVDHDALEYGVQGRIFLRDRAMAYAHHRFDASTGFYYVGLHGFAYPLLFTWEGLVNGLLGVSSDLWTRSSSLYNGGLLLALVWNLLRRRDTVLALAGTVTLALAQGVLFLFLVYHLDGCRILLFTAAVALFVAVLQRPSASRAWLFGGICGAQAFIHSVGAILGGCMLVLLPFFLPGPWRERLLLVLRSALAMLLMGGIHYVLDVFLGTGWIFKDILWF